MFHRIQITISCVVLLQLLLLNASSQEKSGVSKTGSENDLREVTVQPIVQKFSPEKTQLLKDLDQARLNRNIKKKEQLEVRLNEIDNAVPVVSPADVSIQNVIVNKEMENEFDYNYSMIANLPHFSHAVATVPSGSLAGRIYVAVGVYASTPNPDTVKIYYSTNNGTSWVYYSYWFMPGANMDFRANEMDIITVYDGTTAWLFGVSSINWISNNNQRVIFWRYNLTTNDFYRTTLSWPGAPITNLDYNGRIASDDAVNGVGSYIYINVSSDSSWGTGYHVNKTKFALVQTPFAVSPPITYRDFSTTYAGNTSFYVYNDVAYVRPGLSRVFVINSIDGSLNICVVYSNDFGATISGLLILTNSYPSHGSSLASVVADGYPRMMIINRVFASSNGDIQYYFTSTGGTTTGSWTQGYIENTSYRASGYPNVTWVRGSLTDFKTAFTLDSGGMVRPYYAGWNGSAWNSPSRMAVGNLQADSTYACPVAGYRLGGGDNCLTIWSNFYPIYASHSCLTTVGNNNNQNILPETYSLQQNYPNPFNPGTLIKYGIPKQSFVKIAVYDITGKEIETLVNDVKEPGSYEVNWDGSKYASGAYFCKIETEKFSDVKKMILLK